MPVEEDLRIRVDLLTDTVNSQAKEIQRILKQITDEVKQPIGRVGLTEYLEGNTERARDLSQQFSIASQQFRQYADTVNAFNKAALDSFKDFDSARAAVSTLSNDVDGLVAAIDGLANEQDFLISKTDGLTAAYQILSAGYSDTADITEILRQSSLAAAGGFTEVETVADALTSVLNSYGLTTADAARVTDSFVETQNRGKITVAEYAQQIGKLAPIGAQAGVSIFELNGFIATATANGVKAESAISGVRQALVNVIKPTQQAREKAAELGIAFDANALKTKGLVGILEDVTSSSDNLSADLAVLFSDVDSLSLVSNAAGENLDKLRENIEGVGNAAGVTSEQADKVANSIEKRFEAAANRLDSVLSDLGESIAKGITPALEAFVKFLELVDKLPDGAKDAIATFGLLVGVTLALAAAGTAIAAILPAIAAGLGAIGLSAGALLPLLLGITVAIQGLKLAQYARDVAAANKELDEFQRQVEQTANANFQLANQIAAANRRVNESKAEGIALSQEEIDANERLIDQGKRRIEFLQAQLAAAKEFIPANEEQRKAQQNLIAQYEIQINAINKQTSALEKNIEVVKESADANQELALTAEQVAEAQEKSFKRLEDANAKAEKAFETRLQKQLNAERQALIDRQASTEESEAKIAEIELDFSQQRIGRFKAEIEEIARLRDAGTIAAEAANNKLLELNDELARAEEARINSTNTLIEKQAKLREAQEKAAEAAAKELIEERVKGLEREADAIDRQTESLQRQFDIKQQQLELSQAQLDADLSASERTVAGLEEALRLKEQLANLDPKLKENAEQRALIEERLGELGVSAGAKRLEIEEQIFAENERRRQLEEKAFDAQQKAAGLALEAENQRNLLVAQREIIEARIQLIKAGDNEEQKAAAQELLDLANQNLGAVEFQVELSRSILRQQQDSARASFENAQEAERFNDELRLAQAKLKDLEGDSGKLAGNLDGATNSARGLTGALSGARGELGGLNAEAVRLQDNFDVAAQRLRDMSIAAEDLTKNVRELANIDTPGEAAARNKAIDEYNQAIFDARNANRSEGVGVGFGSARRLPRNTRFGDPLTFAEELARQDAIKQGLLEGSEGPRRVGRFNETTPQFREAEALKESIKQVLDEAERLTLRAESVADAAAGSAFGRDSRIADAQELLGRRDDLTRIAQAQVQELQKLLPSDQFFDQRADLREALNRLESTFNSSELADLLRQIRDSTLGNTTINVERQEDTTIAADIDAGLQQSRLRRAGAA
jgi:TP901 family phage tail tape measure protein